MADGGPEKGSRSIRALEILEAAVAAGRPLGVADFTAATGLPKATVHRLCGLLEKEGFLAPDVATKGLTLGHRFRNLALGGIAVGGVGAYRHRILSELSYEIGETCNFNIPAGSEILYVDRVETKWPLRTQLPVGSRVPLHCTASGKLYLASLPAAQRRRLISAIELRPYTENTITNLETLETELETIRREKFSKDVSEFIDGMVAVAVGVTDARGRLAAIIACHAPDVRMNLERAVSYLPAMRRAAAALSADLMSTEEMQT
jgi:DNA-binding IclR family transcriptional regulator